MSIYDQSTSVLRSLPSTKFFIFFGSWSKNQAKLP